MRLWPCPAIVRPFDPTPYAIPICDPDSLSRSTIPARYPGLLFYRLLVMRP